MSKIFFIISLLLFSCKTSLEYHFPMKNNSLQIVAEEIKKVKSVYKEIFLMFGTQDEYFVLQIIPCDNLHKEKIASLKVVNSNRFIEIDGSKYYVVLKYDAQFGIVSKEYITHPATGEKLLAYNKLAVIHDHAVTLYFDKQWNFVKKSSLINYDKVKNK